MSYIHTKEVSPHILVKVRMQEEYTANFNRCLAAKVCPECGEPLTVTIKAIEYDMFNDIYKCTQCEFVHKTGKE